MMECHIQQTGCCNRFTNSNSKFSFNWIQVKDEAKRSQSFTISTILKGKIYLYLNDTLKEHKWI